MTRRKPASPEDAPYKIEVIGSETGRVRDLYHAFLQQTWAQSIGTIVAAFAAMNLVFAVVYLFTGGIANARPGSLFDAFSFSVQTLATIGYGYMYPSSPAAHVIVWIQAITGMLLTAVMTGLVFSKFTLSGAKIVFSNDAVISLVDGVPHLQFRLGNARGNIIAEATVHVAMLRTERTKEGTTMYRLHDLSLVRERTPVLTRSWTVMHAIVPSSLLYDYDADRIAKDEVELSVTVVGTDDTSLQPVHARRTYYSHQILWGRRYVDVLSERPDGTVVLDLRRFHDHEPGEFTVATQAASSST
jgi:inward rectifier potassium channel